MPGIFQPPIPLSVIERLSFQTTTDKPLSAADHLLLQATRRFVDFQAWSEQYSAYVWHRNFDSAVTCAAMTRDPSVEIFESFMNIFTVRLQEPEKISAFLAEQLTFQPLWFFRRDLLKLLLTYGDIELLHCIPAEEFYFFIKQTANVPDAVLGLYRLLVSSNLSIEEKVQFFNFCGKQFNCQSDIIRQQELSIVNEERQEDVLMVKIVRILLGQIPNVLDRVRFIFSLKNPEKWLIPEWLNAFVELASGLLCRENGDYLGILTLKISSEQKIIILCSHENMNNLSVWQRRLSWLEAIPDNLFPDEQKHLHQTICEKLRGMIRFLHDEEHREREGKKAALLSFQRERGEISDEPAIRRLLCCRETSERIVLGDDEPLITPEEKEEALIKLCGEKSTEMHKILNRLFVDKTIKGTIKQGFKKLKQLLRKEEENHDPRYQFISAALLTDWDALLARVECADQYLPMTFRKGSSQANVLFEWIKNTTTDLLKQQRLACIVQKCSDAAVSAWLSNFTLKEDFFAIFMQPLLMLDLSPLMLICDKPLLSQRVTDAQITGYLNGVVQCHREYARKYHLAQLLQIQQRGTLALKICIKRAVDSHSFPVSRGSVSLPVVNQHNMAIYQGILKTPLQLSQQYDCMMMDISPNFAENLCVWASVTSIALDAWAMHYAWYLAIKARQSCFLAAQVAPVITEKRMGPKKQLLHRTEREEQAHLESLHADARKAIQAVQGIAAQLLAAEQSFSSETVRRILKENLHADSPLWFFGYELTRLLLQYGDESSLNKLSDVQIEMFIELQRETVSQRMAVYQLLLLSQLPQIRKKSLLFYWVSHEVPSLDFVLALENASLDFDVSQSAELVALREAVLEDIFMTFLVFQGEKVTLSTDMQLFSRIKGMTRCYQWAIQSPYLSADRKKMLFRMILEDFFYRDVKQFCALKGSQCFHKEHQTLVENYFSLLREALKVLKGVSRIGTFLDAHRKTRVIEIALSSNEAEKLTVPLLKYYLGCTERRLTLPEIYTRVLNASLLTCVKKYFFTGDLRELSTEMREQRLSDLMEAESTILPAHKAVWKDVCDTITTHLQIIPSPPLVQVNINVVLSPIATFFVPTTPTPPTMPGDLQAQREYLVRKI